VWAGAGETALKSQGASALTRYFIFDMGLTVSPGGLVTPPCDAATAFTREQKRGLASKPSTSSSAARQRRAIKLEYELVAPTPEPGLSHRARSNSASAPDHQQKRDTAVISYRWVVTVSSAETGAVVGG
jgi:hypothetical protein